MRDLGGGNAVKPGMEKMREVAALQSKGSVARISCLCVKCGIDAFDPTARSWIVNVEQNYCHVHLAES